MSTSIKTFNKLPLAAITVILASSVSAKAAVLCQKVLRASPDQEQINIAIESYTKMSRELDVEMVMATSDTMGTLFREEQKAKMSELVKDLNISPNQFLELVRKKNKSLSDQVSPKDLQRERQQRQTENQLFRHWKLKKSHNHAVGLFDRVFPDNNVVMLIRSPSLIHLDLATGGEQSFQLSSPERIEHKYLRHSLALKDSLLILKNEAEAEYFDLKTLKLREWKTEPTVLELLEDSQYKLSSSKEKIVAYSEDTYFILDSKSGTIIARGPIEPGPQATFEFVGEKTIFYNNGKDSYLIFEGQAPQKINDQGSIQSAIATSQHDVFFKRGSTLFVIRTATASVEKKEFPAPIQVQFENAGVLWILVAGTDPNKVLTLTKVNTADLSSTPLRDIDRIGDKTIYDINEQNLLIADSSHQAMELTVHRKSDLEPIWSFEDLYNHNDTRIFEQHFISADGQRIVVTGSDKAISQRSYFIDIWSKE